MCRRDSVFGLEPQAGLVDSFSSCTCPAWTLTTPSGLQFQTWRFGRTLARPSMDTRTELATPPTVAECCLLLQTLKQVISPPAFSLHALPCALQRRCHLRKRRGAGLTLAPWNFRLGSGHKSRGFTDTDTDTDTRIEFLLLSLMGGMKGLDGRSPDIRAIDVRCPRRRRQPTPGTLA